MKKLFVLFCCVVVALFPHDAIVCAQTTVVRFMVELPAQGISQDSAVYIAGSFNGWNPLDENYKMSRVDSRHYKLDVPCFTNKKYEYKYSLGGWEHVEKTADGKDVENRKFTSANRAKIKDIVSTWNAPTVKKESQNQLMSLLTKEQISQIMQMKDSITKNLAPAIPQFMAVLQKINMNLLADKPDMMLEKQYNTEAIGVVSQLVDSLTNTLLKMMEVLTPEQKQKMRDMMKNSSNPGDFINMITNPKATPSNK